MTRDAALKVLVVALVVIAGAALHSRGKWLGMAEAAGVRADSLSGLVDALADENASQLARVFARDSAYRTDSIAWAAEAAALRSRIDVARARASDAAASLRASLDSAQARLFATYEAEVEAERAAHAAIVSSLHAERDMLQARVADRDELIRGLYAEIDIRTAETSELRAANAALRNAVAPSVWTRIAESWATHAVVAVAGYGLGRLM